jgi:excisionase family DNA binding protein
MMNDKLILTQLTEERLCTIIQENTRKVLQEIYELGSVEDQIFNSIQASEFLGISSVTLDAWLKEKRIPFKREGRRLLFSKRQLLQWINEGNGISLKKNKWGRP